MYMNGLTEICKSNLAGCMGCVGDCGCSGKKTLNGLANSESDNIAMQAAAAYFTGGASLAAGGGGGGSSPAVSNQNRVDTTTSVNTQVSPVISPNFVQQDHPVNSAVSTTTTANPSQTLLPTVPMTGAIPGFDNATPYPATLPAAPPASWIPGVSNDVVMYGAAGALIIAVLLKAKKQKA